MVRVAVPSPLRRSFDYLPPAGGVALEPGMRVRVPFGRGARVGVVLEVGVETEVEAARLKRVAAVLDREPLLDTHLLALLRWAAAYFHHPVGEVVLGAVPAALRRGGEARAAPAVRWRASAAGAALDPAVLARAPRQMQILARLRTATDGLDAPALAETGGAWRDAVGALEAKGFAERYAIEARAPPSAAVAAAPALALNPAQTAVVETVRAELGRFAPFLLDGVTGSGKTEVYLGLIESVLARGEQALVLIPEIGLTPQALDRFRRRLGDEVVLMHSGVPDAQRLRAWRAARDGTAPVVLGTRSALFAPLPRPGLVIVDEEHDPSYKQQDGFRYSARDLAVMRARGWAVPIVLGSATPSLESLHNVETGRYRTLRLAQRAGAAAPPRVDLVDLRGRPFDEGLSAPLLDALAETLERGEQALLFVNRRGYAPMLICHACGWVAECERCDARLVLHREQDVLRCHHCLAERPVPATCGDCGAADLRALGLGTQRVVDALRARLPSARIDRMDRDSTRRSGALQAVLDGVHEGRTQILVGTQMIAKGHHFPDVTLVGILDADTGLFSVDFRAPERMAQLLVQVAGRAGRAERAGRVLVQTHHPGNPLLERLIRAGYRAFADSALREREEAGLPPFSAMALLRAEAARAEPARAFLEQAREAATPFVDETVRLLGPVPAPMERRAGRHRAQLLVESDTRGRLQRFLSSWIGGLEGLPSGRRVRWSLDVDPQEMV